MRSFKDKLASLGMPGATPKTTVEPEAQDVLSGPLPVEKDDRLAALRRAIHQIEKKTERRARTEPVSIECMDTLPGEVTDTAWGPLHRVAKILEPHHCHGRMPVAQVLQSEGRAIATLSLDPLLEDVDLQRLLVLDLETTGLSGGTGTLPFLLGMAWFEDQSLHVEQLFLRRPGEEGPMLRRFAERMAASSVLVTFNGKSFDWPLLRTRFVMNRIPVPTILPHLDVLHCARRVFRRRLSETRLGTLEREVLGHDRQGDISGAAIPQIYLDYLRTGVPTGIDAVIEHNAHDLVAVPAVMAELCRRLGSLHSGADVEPADLLALAELSVRADDETSARAFARASCDAGADDDTGVMAWMLEARLARRAEQPEAEEQALLRALDLAGGVDEVRGAVHLSLSKFYEHRRKDAALALTHARHAAVVEDPQASERRIARLEKRMLRPSPAPRAESFSGKVV